LVGPAINKIADKYYFSGIVLEHTCNLAIIEFNQQSPKRIRVSVDIPDYVVTFVAYGHFCSGAPITTNGLRQQSPVMLYVAVRRLSQVLRNSLTGGAVSFSQTSAADSFQRQKRPDE
jgi:hypothetical protein